MRILVRGQPIPPLIVVPNRCGTDVNNVDRTRDAHIRLEEIEEDEPEEICVDVFNSKIPREAKTLDPHLESDCFPNTPKGAAAATEFLKLWEIFNVEVKEGGAGPMYCQ